MGDTSIQWTDKTWNPVRGCSRVSQGCVNCYAERQALRFSAPPNERTTTDNDEAPEFEKAGPFHGFVTKVNGHASWTGKVELVESMLNLPLTWKKPARVFVNSMSDLFHEALPFEDIDQIFTVMVAAPEHTYQILTKRPARMLGYFNSGRHDGGNGPDRATYHLEQEIWLGVSVEDQATADERIPLLLKTPAAKRLVSYEPALGPVDFAELMCDCHTSGMCHGKHGIDWVIVGGESGPGARPFNIAWAENTVAQCKAANVACFVKQFGAKPIETIMGVNTTGQRVPYTFPITLRDKKGGDMAEWPSDLRVREFPR